MTRRTPHVADVQESISCAPAPQLSVEGTTPPVTETTTRELQPLLHDATVCINAPALAISSPDGQMRDGVHGFYVSDRRYLRRLVLLADGSEPEHLRGHLVGSTARFTAVVRTVGEVRPDPAVIIERRRAADCDLETVTVRSASRIPVDFEVTVVADTDLADMTTVKRGAATPALPVVRTTVDGGEAACWQTPDGLARATLRSTPPPDRLETGSGEARLTWRLCLEPGESRTLQLHLDVDDDHETAPPVALTVAGPAPWSSPAIRCDDARLPALLDRSLADLRGLLLADAAAPTDRFLGAGAPWFLTLFGRDALWASRMMLPLGTDLAMSTLRVLARRQGEAHDTRTEEAPGKILHEARRDHHAPAAHLGLPPVYYGTIDATPLFVSVLADAWRWGHDEAEVAELLPHAERALRWVMYHADPDADGFLEYAGSDGGLANQGWKDSDDGVQFADGRLAEGPIALCEVQGYAYQAALDGALLFDAFGRPGGDKLRSWAAALKERFRRAFWVDDELGAFPAIALDAGKRPVDAPASNMAHLLATGILDAQECALVAARLAHQDLDSGWGLRTMSMRTRGYNPLSYHGGSVWPHDTAIAVAGLAATGHTDIAARLLHGLVDAAGWFDFRLPELYGGEPATPDHAPLPYPAACRPQAWSAAAAVSLLGSLLGLQPDVPGGVVRLSPLRPAPYALVDVEGLRVAGEEFSVRLDESGVHVRAHARGLHVVVDPAST